MILSRLDITSFRIINRLTLDLHPRLNLITGSNGSGKSSILESVQCLATGHSFRTRKPRELIRHEDQFYQLTALFNDMDTEREHRAGLRRDRNNSVNLRLDYEEVQNQSQIARLLPVKALTPDSHQLIQEGPDIRRQFLDWGLFHVEHSFLSTWKQFKRALSQRNQLLRDQADELSIATWNKPLATAATQISQARTQYVEKLNKAVISRLTAMNVMFHVKLRHRQGWDRERDINDVLQDNIALHRRMKTTTDGPHRADLIIECDNGVAKQVLSRGEQKVLVYAMHLAQLDILADVDTSGAIVLCDDLTSELDNFHAKALIAQLMDLDGQLLVSGVDLSLLTEHSHERFHMEHGTLEKRL